LFAPAIQLARNGFPVSDYLALQINKTAQLILSGPPWTAGLREIFAPKGSLLRVGDTVVMSRLANTLEMISVQGVDVLYKGPLTASFVKDIQQAGGIITEQDLANYTVVFREPLTTFYEGYKIIGAFPPFSGGVCSLFALDIIELYNLPELGALHRYPEAIHWLLEGLRYAYADRLALGDPSFTNLSSVLALMMSKDHAAKLRNNLSPNQTFPPNHYVDIVQPVFLSEDHGTTHFSIVDAERNTVAITSTINLTFGSKFISTSTGILLNDEMDDFSSPNSSNSFGFPPSVANFIVPNKRPLSSMTPTIVLKDDNLYLSLGGSGGSTIITGVTQVLLNVLAFRKNIMEAVSMPRFHCQLFPNTVYVESNFDMSAVQFLAKIGNQMYLLSPGSVIGSVVQAVMVGPDGYLYAASDWRKQGEPAGY